jgi:hypothetical protein
MHSLAICGSATFCCPPALLSSQTLNNKGTWQGAQCGRKRAHSRRSLRLQHDPHPLQTAPSHQAAQRGLQASSVHRLHASHARAPRGRSINDTYERGVRTGSAREATHAHLRALRAPWCTCLLCLARHDSRETTCRGSVGSVVAHNVISWSGEQLTFRMPCAWKRWRAGELCHPTGHERMRSPTLQTLQDPILLALTL